ncbi:MAG: sigma-70 family RNA polymerase sigma factor [Clostridia bacterium]|nr:sigma-70 family RNA polymerase sigma factor [Clostridia bacterium]
MGDEEIIEMLFLRAEESISVIDEKYGATCRKIAKDILGNDEDAEECVNDAYFKLWNAVPPEKPVFLAAYLYKIVRNLSMKRLTRNTAEKRSATFCELLTELEDYLPGEETVESQAEQRELARVIEEFLDTLTPDNRKVFMRRYWFSESYEKIARDLGMSKGNVSMRLVRTREKMRKFLKERGIEV